MTEISGLPPSTPPSFFEYPPDYEKIKQELKRLLQEFLNNPRGTTSSPLADF